ncbi:MAG TPA: aminotransferase [Rhizomicrobium sp.]|nr:aminotransferase [Rhizomicrobium sp.]
MPEGSRFNPVFETLPTTIFTVMSAAAAKYGAVNLGQGFPDEDGPPAIRAAAAQSLLDGPNQYPPTRGVPELRRAIAAHAARFHGLDINPDTEVVVTSGATEALAACIMALAGQGGEIVLLDPAYDCYRPIADVVGATVRTVALQPPHWRLNEADLRAAITARTRVLLINTPMNPIGRVLDRQELDIIARVIAPSNAMVVCDEVYEHLVFDGRAHIPLMSLPGMRERTVRCGSAGKMFSLTGWKVGWVSGPPAAIEVVAKAHQFLTFTTPPALQLGIAHALEHEMDFTLGLTRRLQDNRDCLASGLSRLGFELCPSEGTYFLTADFSGLSDEPDHIFCERLVREAGVAAIPLSAFFANGKPDRFVRFAFCKQRAVIENALSRLQHYFGK